MKDDRIKLVYKENNVRVILGYILTNHSMTIDEALELCNIDMDKFAEKQGWDGWDPSALSLEYTEDVSNLISINVYAAMHNRATRSVRQKAQLGGFETARKIGRDWQIDRGEQYTDKRKKPE